LIPPHRNYIEVFAGSGKLLFAKEPSELEVLNDANGEVTNFFRVAKHRSAELAERFALECIHAGRFKELRSTPDQRDEVDRALRFAYLVWYSFGAKGEHFARASAKNPSMQKPLDRVRELLQRTAERLSSVLIEQRDYAEILDRYDGPDTFFYLDPPYVEFEPNGRYRPLSEERRREMFERLASLRSRWLMSFEDHKEARAAASAYGFRLRKVGVVYTLNGSVERKQSPELLLSNFQFSAA
jgi:DNA adenine methylase